MKAYDFLAGQAWAILPSALDSYFAILEARPELAAKVLRGPEAVKGKAGDRVKGTQAVTIRQGVATIPVYGPIMRHATLLSDVCGGATIERLATDLNAAIDNPEVKAIIIDFDTPGGQANGIGEMAAMIRKLSAVKPIVGYASNMACSAGYWLLSACSEVVVSPTATLGSIGTILQLNTKEKPGDRTFVSSQSPKKRPDPDTDEGKGEIQGWIDALSDLFIADVASYRGTTAKKVMSDFGQGGVKVGQAAVKAGMADATGDFETTLARLASGEMAVKKPDGKPPKSIEKSSPSGAKSMNPFAIIGSLFAKNPEAVNEAIAEVSASGDDQPKFDVSKLQGFAGKLVGAPVESAEAIEARVKESLAKDLSSKSIESLRSFFAGHAGKAYSVFLAAGKVLPSEEAVFKAMYVVHALADHESGPIALAGGGTASRLDHFVDSVESRKPNGKTEEKVPADAGHVAAKLAELGGKLLPQAAATEEEAKTQAAARRLEQMLNATDAGKAHLASKAK